MSQKKSKATRRSISILKQIVTGVLPGWKIAKFAANEKIKAREFSYDAQIHLLMLGHLLHLFSLNELADVSQIYASHGLFLKQLHLVGNDDYRTVQGAVGGRAAVQGTEADHCHTIAA